MTGETVWYQMIGHVVMLTVLTISSPYFKQVSSQFETGQVTEVTDRVSRTELTYGLEVAPVGNYDLNNYLRQIISESYTLVLKKCIKGKFVLRLQGGDSVPL